MLEATGAALSCPFPGRVGDDSTLVTERIFAVADGADLGAGAGREALAQLQRLLGLYPSARSLARALNVVNFALWQRDDGQGALRSTLTAALLLGSRIAVGHVGDTRAYLVREERLFCLTSNEDGPDSSRPDDGVPRLGFRPPVATPHVRRYLLHDADRLVLCTDGLWRRASQDDFVFSARMPPSAACEFLCSRSIADEEASVVAVTFRETAPQVPPEAHGRTS